MARTTFAQHGLVRLGYEIQGEASPLVLLLHGLLADRASLRPLMDALDERATVIAMDMRGHGGSSAIHGVDLQLDDLVGDAFSVLDAADVHQPVAIVGVELGAVVAARMQEASPDRVAATVLVNYPSGLMLDVETITDIANRAYKEQVEQALNRWLDLSWGEGWQARIPRPRVAAARRSASAIHPVLTAIAAAELETRDSLSLPLGIPFADEESVAQIANMLTTLFTSD